MAHLLDFMECLINKSSEKMIIVVQRPNMSMKYRSVEVLFKNIVLTVFKTY